MRRNSPSRNEGHVEAYSAGLSTCSAFLRSHRAKQKRVIPTTEQPDFRAHSPRTGFSFYSHDVSKARAIF
jgi:hypothetical protein